MKNRKERIYEILGKALLDSGFRKEYGASKKEMQGHLAACGLPALAEELAELPSDRRFSEYRVLAAAEKYFPELREAPEAGWLQYAYQCILHQLYPALGISETEKFRKGRVLLLQILRGLYEAEKEFFPFDPVWNMTFLSDSEVEEGGFSREYIRLHRLVKHRYVYEFMRIGREITPFNTLGHISGVHYVAMFCARQLYEAGVPVDLAIVSGAAAGHDIGKYGCKKSEEKRIPYLHYYYTDRCFRQFGLNTIGHIAANHSVWDLELEDLSVESLLLIYADFRVKSSRNAEGEEIVHFYSLKESYDVILNKLDNVDEAKRKRYTRVYAKLADFEAYMEEQGVQTALPPDLRERLSQPAVPVKREAVLLDGEPCIQQIKYQAIDHNIRLMSRFP